MKYLIPILIIFLIGCTPQTIIKREIVEVPVVVIRDAPKPAEVIKYELPINKLKIADNPTPKEIAKAIVDTIIILEAEIKQHEEAIKPFKQQE